MRSPTAPGRTLRVCRHCEIVALLLVLPALPALPGLTLQASPGITDASCAAACVDERRAEADGMVESGDYQTARDTLLTLLAMPATTGRLRGRVLDSLGWAEYRLGEHTQALARFRDARALLTSGRSDRTLPEAALLDYRIGLAQRERGEYELADLSLSDALAAARALGDRTLEARVLNGLGGVAYYRSAFAEAVDLFERALAQQRAARVDALDIAGTLNNLAVVQSELGAYADASRLYREALAIRRERFGPRHPSLCSTLINSGMVAEAQGDTEEAGRLYAAALEIVQSEVAQTHPLAAIALDGLGRVQRMNGEYGAALRLHQQGLAMRRNMLEPTDPYLAESLNHMAAAELDLGDAERARDHWIDALVISEAAGEPGLIIDAYHGIARTLRRAGDGRAAIIFGKLAIADVQAIRGELAPLPEDLKNGYASRREPIFRSLATLLIDQGRLPEASAVLGLVRNEELYQYTRGRLVDRADTGLPLSERETMRAEPFLTARRSLRTAGGTGSVDEAVRGRYRLALEELIRGKRPEPGPPTTIAERRAPPSSVASGTARLIYIVDEQSVRIILQTVDGTLQRATAASRPAVNRDIFALRSALSDPRRDPGVPAEALYRILIAPIADELRRQHISRLQLSLDGAMRYIPFATLYDGERYLVETYEMLRLVEGAGVAHVTSAEASVVGFGVTRPPAGDLPALPYVREELETIVRHGEHDPDGALPGELFLDEAFSLAALERLSGRTLANVHIASHFIFRPGRVSDSYLVVGSGAPVSLAEFARLDLSGIDWLALSACETALGGGDRTARGTEIAGLGAVAHARGAGAVLASLWQVSDRATSRFMRHLYRERAAGRDGVTALRTAQLDALRGDRLASSTDRFRFDPRAPYAHPFFWGAFVVMGQ